MISLFLVSVLAAAQAAATDSGDVCLDRMPSSERLTELGVKNPLIEPGLVDSQLSAARSPYVVETERLWGYGRKIVYPEHSLGLSLKAIEVAFYLRPPSLLGVGIWHMRMNGRDVTDLAELYLNGRKIPPGDWSPFEIRRHPDRDWETLTIVLSEPLTMGPDDHLEYYARTFFEEPFKLKNLLAGTRADACVYFIF